ncbi:Hypothetical predicted protein [Marmota monax]|uniref:Uncharacterized protein n=1 Tax=Marmota monax TaxID=9995 RepID=A0A5E4AWT7_MARMO|nr:hypothetical protein GHT09_007420 [Marmota monax]VTJ60979.1 Hypothetical predicted protein [Marmota monax]
MEPVGPEYWDRNTRQAQCTAFPSDSKQPARLDQSDAVSRGESPWGRPDKSGGARSSYLPDSPWLHPGAEPAPPPRASSEDYRCRANVEEECVEWLGRYLQCGKEKLQHAEQSAQSIIPTMGIITGPVLLGVVVTGTVVTVIMWKKKNAGGEGGSYTQAACKYAEN